MPRYRDRLRALLPILSTRSLHEKECDDSVIWDGWWEGDAAWGGSPHRLSSSSWVLRAPCRATAR